MQLIFNGPDIPDELLQAHEEGRVIFFCGAGISYPAGLPGFKGLVEQLYDKLGVTYSEVEKKAFDNSQYDATIGFLERRYPGQRNAVRKKLIDILNPNLRKKGAAETHSALLRLAQDRGGALRLVTTNFDRIFEYVSKREKIKHQVYDAPMLPVPKKSRWNGLVYLHGILPIEADCSALNRLVISSGDFGNAYISERWASRFISELFRNYVVCFVGYSINDPIMRYMMDALAADKMLGEIVQQAYAFGDCEVGQEEKELIEWESKGVKPILYTKQNPNDHSKLHQTLIKWAEIYRDGILGKEKIVVQYALARPSASTQQDNYVSRMIWALSDSTGNPAKRFAEINPTPPFDWFDELVKCRFSKSDLSRFGITQNDTESFDRIFSLVERPAHYYFNPFMSLLNNNESIRWDNIMIQIARWITRHLNSPELILWIANNGGVLHDRFRYMIESELTRIRNLEVAHNDLELNKLREQSPDAIPNTTMYKLWRLVLLNRLKTRSSLSENIYHWIDGLKISGLNASLRLELRNHLTPKVLVKEQFQYNIAGTSNVEKPETKAIDWEIVLASDYVYTSLFNINNENWLAARPLLVDDFQLLLLDALELMQELGNSEELIDRSVWDLPSIQHHWQNNRFKDWVALIELLRDAWIDINEIDSDRAEVIAQGWIKIKYPTFKRLAFFAATVNNSISVETWLYWLISDQGRWLWSFSTRREVLRLLVIKGQQLKPHLTEIESAILAGPPQSEFRSDLEVALKQELLDHSIWLRLMKLSSSGLCLSHNANERLNELSKRYSKWRLADDESDEFPFWMSGTGDPDFEKQQIKNIAPRKRADLVKWLRQYQKDDDFLQKDNWDEFCRKSFCHSLVALRDLAKENLWPVSRWNSAIYIWCDKNLILRSWQYAAPIIAGMPDEVLKKVSQSVSRWLLEISNKITIHQEIFFFICQRILNIYSESSSEKSDVIMQSPISNSINHDIGQITEALINVWFLTKPKDNDLLPKHIEPFFTMLCDRNIEIFIHGRVQLSSKIIPFFRIDKEWTEQHLIPFFDWSQNRDEAIAAWSGFLWSPRIYWPLMITLKNQFLKTAEHYIDLGNLGRQYVVFLTFIALDHIEIYHNEDFNKAYMILPKEALREAVNALIMALEGAGEQICEYWANRILPFWNKIWPKNTSLLSSELAEVLTIFCIKANVLFPSAVDLVIDWLQPVERSFFVLNRLIESDLCSKFPTDVLRLLDKIIEKPKSSTSELVKCLDAVEAAMPVLKNDPVMKRLRSNFN